MAEVVHNPLILPDNLPVPQDDGAARHLQGARLPDVVLAATNATAVNLSKLAGRNVVYVYPRTGRPGQDLPTGWDGIPGARGCTPQSCGYRDWGEELRAMDATVVGLSAQTLEEQREAAERLDLPHAVAADPELRLAEALRLPTFEFEGRQLYKRLALVAEEGRIVKVFYPVFPPDENAAQVLAWLRGRLG